jgi:plastocyanin
MSMTVKRVLLAALVTLAAVTLTAAGPAGSGSITGKVTYTGTPAKSKSIDMSKEPSCASQHATPITTESVVTGPGNTLENVVVYISAGAPDEPPPSTSANFVQKGCQYLPHVLAFQVGQELKISNDDQTSHNIHPLAKINREWNKSQPPGTPPITDKYDKAEMIPVKCNIHPWMHGNFAVLKNSHYAITTADGSFKLPNLPPGKYTVTAWHEPDQEMTQDVVISGSEAKTISFVFNLKPY